MRRVANCTPPSQPGRRVYGHDPPAIGCLLVHGLYYCGNLDSPTTLRLMGGWTVEAAETYRWSSSTSPHGYGINLQTLPKHLRYYLVAPEGRVFVGGDLSQAEARVVAYLSGCSELIECFNDPKRSVHLENAIAVFGHAVEKDTPEYTLAKAVVHASNYREGAYVFSTQSGLPVATTRKLLDNYHRKRPEIKLWHDWVWQTIKNQGVLSTPLGDTRTFYEAISCFSLTGKMTDQHWKDAIAWVPQSTVPHVLNLGLLHIAKLRDQGLDVQFHHQGHDSFLCSVPEGNENEFFSLVQPFYAAVKLVGPGGVYNIPQEYSTGFSFGDMFGWSGSSMSHRVWQKKVDEKLSKHPRDEQILRGVYGAMLKDWRP